MASDAHNKSSWFQLPLVALVFAAVAFVGIWSHGPMARWATSPTDSRREIAAKRVPNRKIAAQTGSTFDTQVVQGGALRQARSKTDDAQFDHEFWKRAIDNEIRSLRGHVSDRVALQAGWELVRRGVKPDGPPELSARFPRLTIDRAELQRFVGLLEGRLRIALPAWWEKGLLEAMPISNGDIVARCRYFYSELMSYYLAELDVPIPDDLRPYLVDPELPALTTSIFVPDDVVLELQGDRVRVTVRTRTVSIDVQFQQDNHFHSASTLVDGNLVYISFNQYSESEVRCIDADTGKLKWQATTRRRRFGGNVEGPKIQFAELLLAGARLYAFGDDTGLAYVDGFSTDTGDLELSFQTEND